MEVAVGCEEDGPVGVTRKCLEGNDHMGWSPCVAMGIDGPVLTYPLPQSSYWKDNNLHDHPLTSSGALLFLTTGAVICRGNLHHFFAVGKTDSLPVKIFSSAETPLPLSSASLTLRPDVQFPTIYFLSQTLKKFLCSFLLGMFIFKMQALNKCITLCIFTLPKACIFLVTPTSFLSILLFSILPSSLDHGLKTGGFCHFLLTVALGEKLN